MPIDSNQAGVGAADKAAALTYDMSYNLLQVKMQAGMSKMSKDADTRVADAVTYECAAAAQMMQELPLRWRRPAANSQQPAVNLWPARRVLSAMVR